MPDESFARTEQHIQEGLQQLSVSLDPPKPPERTYRRGFRFTCQDGVDLYIEEAKDGGVSLQLSDGGPIGGVYLTAKQWEDLRGLYVRGEL